MRAAIVSLIAVVFLLTPGCQSTPNDTYSLPLLQETDTVVATVPDGADVLDSSWSSDGKEVAYCARKDRLFWIARGDWTSPTSARLIIPILPQGGKDIIYAAFGNETSKVYLNDKVLFETQSMQEWSWRLPGTVSTDGKVLASNVNNLKSGKSGIAINGTIGELYAGTVSLPVLSGNGRVCAFVLETDGRSCVVVNGKQGAVYDRVTQPAVSPNGNIVAYAAETGKEWFLIIGERKSSVAGPIGGVFLGVEGTKVGYWKAYGNGPDSRQRVVVDGRECQEFSRVSQPKFSPDGNHIVYSARTPDDNTLIVVDERLFTVQDLRSLPVFLSGGRQVGFGYRKGRELRWKIVGVGNQVEEPQAVNTAPESESGQAQAIVDELASTTVSAWSERVRALEEPLRLAVNRELGRRAIARGEDPKDNGEKPSKEWEATQILLSRGDWLKGSFTDFLVWAKFHEGRGGLYNIWMMGMRTFPSVLKLRQDRHRVVHVMVGYFIVEYVLGSYRGHSHKDASVEAFCREELQKCPMELRPHYRAVLAALGDDSCLDAIPLLLASDIVADWQYAHHLIEGMFGTASPYTKDLMSEPNSDYIAGREEGVAAWASINKSLLEWWRANRGRMSYDKRDGHWHLDKQ